jgi:hypothetical protein
LLQDGGDSGRRKIQGQPLALDGFGWGVATFTGLILE